MARAPNLSNLPSHASIAPSITVNARVGGHMGPCMEVTCPLCKQTRLIAVRTLRHQASKPAFTGACRPCWLSQPKARSFRTNRNKTGFGVNGNGYTTLHKNAISDEDLDLFNQMRSKAGFVLQHRWRMAKHLGRALTPHECVDHMNGHKQDNEIENLRIYVRGKQQPGSCPGHGTYYHEWQSALLRIKELEAQITPLV